MGIVDGWSDLETSRSKIDETFINPRFTKSPVESWRIYILMVDRLRKVEIKNHRYWEKVGKFGGDVEL